MNTRITVPILLILCGITGEFTARHLFSGELAFWYWTASTLMIVAGGYLLVVRLARRWQRQRFD